MLDHKLAQMVQLHTLDLGARCLFSRRDKTFLSIVIGEKEGSTKYALLLAEISGAEKATAMAPEVMISEELQEVTVLDVSDFIALGAYGLASYEDETENFEHGAVIIQQEGRFLRCSAWRRGGPSVTCVDLNTSRLAKRDAGPGYVLRDWAVVLTRADGTKIPITQMGERKFDKNQSPYSPN